MSQTLTPYMPVYRRAPVTMVRGEGMVLFDDSGKRYLDCAAGIATNALGHGHPHVVGALKKQADILWHCSNNTLNNQLKLFAERLVNKTFADSVFFGSSGSEAVEACIKFIRRYQFISGQPQRNRIITFEGGFHGRSMACISAGGNDIARMGYAPLLDGFDRVAFNDIAAVRAAITPETAGILIEPVQGEGGINVADQTFLQGLRTLCHEHGLLLCFDEVQCGYGRCGALLTHELYSVTPDLVAVAKGIGNGFPLSACLANAKVASTLSAGCHGSTYGSNPLAMAVGNAVLDVMQEDGFFEHVKVMGTALKVELEQVAKDFPSLIKDVRGMGLMIGVAMAIPAREFSDVLRENGLLVAPCYGDVLRFVPPLIIEREQIDEAVEIFRKTLAVIPAKAGIQQKNDMDSGLRRNDTGV